MPAWQPIDGYEGRYEVSSDGRVRCVEGRELGQWANDAGYLLVRLSRPRCIRRVHRLVARAFLPNPQNLPVVNHKDHVRSHNDVANLEWCTQRENLRHAERAGRMPRDYWVGRRSPNARLTGEQVAQIREIRRTGASLQTLARAFGVSKRAIGRVVSGETYAL